MNIFVNISVRTFAVVLLVPRNRIASSRRHVHVIGRIMALQKNVLATCKYITLHGKNDFPNAVEIKELQKGR